MGAQDLLNSFYNIDNLVSIEITIDPTQWNDLVLTAKPRELPPPKPDGSQEVNRYDWTTATSVTISGTKFPEKSTFTNVGIIKKSFWGSLSYTKPSLKLDFTRSNAANEDAIKDLIGTDRLTLNNCKQDPAYVRQPLGYELFRQADVPSFRCNFATVRVNGKFWGGKDGDKEDTVDPRSPPADGIYVNLESLKKKFLENRFNNDKGNAYEISSPDDFDPDRLRQGYLSFEGFSKHKDRKDLLRAAQEMKDHGLSGAKKVVGWDEYTRYFAMEALVRHWDGYNLSMNNTYIYNDVQAKANPEIKKTDINFKFIPSGIDRILGDDTGILFSGWKSVLAQLTLADNDATANLYDQILKLADKIFGAENLADVIYPYLNKELDVLKSANASFRQADIDIVKHQLDNIHSWAYAKVRPPKP